MALSDVQTGLRTVEVSRALLQHLHGQVPRQTRRLWVHGKGGAADKYVQVLLEMYERIQACLGLRLGPFEGEQPALCEYGLYRSCNVVTAAGKPLSMLAIHRIITEDLLSAGV